jgi:4-aminobutyrate aminotransferase-like enzyme
MRNATQHTRQLLERFESRNITYFENDGNWPIVWQRAKGMHVWDAEGEKYVDLTSAFGVAATGHARPEVVRAGVRQMKTLMHAMGDVHPHALKAELCQELSQLTFERWTRRNGFMKYSGAKRWGKTIFCNSGSEAVEAALKTATAATGRKEVIAFRGAYHGLGYGALNPTHRDHFKTLFNKQITQFAHFVHFPETDDPSIRNSSESFSRLNPNTAPLAQVLEEVQTCFKNHDIGAILLEPVQARGGNHIPPPTFLVELRKLCNQHGALLVLDEIYTGFGRTGKWFACEHARTLPDLICIGKALTGGFPLSACIGRDDWMDKAWPISNGEAIHTSTFLGHPVGCAMALEQIRVIKEHQLIARAAKQGRLFKRLLEEVADQFQPYAEARAIGLMGALEFRTPKGETDGAKVFNLVCRMLDEGYIILPEGDHGHVMGFTPPLIISESTMRRAFKTLIRTGHAAE